MTKFLLVSTKFTATLPIRYFCKNRIYLAYSEALAGCAVKFMFKDTKSTIKFYRDGAVANSKNSKNSTQLKKS